MKTLHGKILIISGAMLIASGCCMPYARYLKRVDAISMELRDIQKYFSVISRQSREIDDAIVSSDGKTEGTFLMMDDVNGSILNMKTRINDILKALRATQSPCNNILKSYNETLQKVIITLGYDVLAVPVFIDDPIKIIVNGELENVTLSKVEKYDAFLPDIDMINNYLWSLDLFYRAYRFKVLDKNFYAYSLAPYEYKDKNGQPIYTYMVGKREITTENIDAEYLDKLKQKMLGYEQELKELVASLIKKRNDFELYLNAKKAGK